MGVSISQRLSKSFFKCRDTFLHLNVLGYLFANRYGAFRTDVLLDELYKVGQSQGFF